MTFQYVSRVQVHIMCHSFFSLFTYRFELVVGFWHGTSDHMTIKLSVSAAVSGLTEC